MCRPFWTEGNVMTATTPQADVKEVSRARFGLGGSLALWIGVLGGPLLWGIQLQVCYMIIPKICWNWHHKHWILHALTVVFAVLTLATGFIAWMEWGRAAAAAESEEQHAGWPRFMSALGMLT